MSNYLKHVEDYLEKQKAGDSLYGDLLPNAVRELCECFSKQNHSGMSFGIVWQMFADINLKYYHPDYELSSVKRGKETNETKS